MNKKIKIGIFGLGAIGSAMAALLTSEPHCKPYYYHRNPKSAIQIIQVDKSLEIPIVLQGRGEKPIALDWLIICLKEYHFPAASKQLQALIGPSTKVAVIRNGLRLKKPLLKFTSPEKILAVMIDCPVQAEGDGYYRMFYPPILTLKRGLLADDFSTLFASSSVCIQQVEDFLTATWSKLLESAALGAVLCLSGETCWILKDEKLRELYEDLLREGLAVARADGADLREELLAELLVKMERYPPEKGSSMLSDRRAGRPIEIGAKSGIIVALGKEYHIKTPLHELVCTLLKYTNQQQN